MKLMFQGDSMEREKLIAVQRNCFGDIISFQTSGGRIISYRKALNEVETGLIGGVEIIEVGDGSSRLKSEANHTDFGNLPVIY